MPNAFYEAMQNVLRRQADCLGMPPELLGIYSPEEENRPTLGQTLARIDAATGCQQCGKPLGPSPSDDFCGEGCQYAWHAKRSSAHQPSGYAPHIVTPPIHTMQSCNLTQFSTDVFEVGDRMTIDMQSVGGSVSHYEYDGIRWNSVPHEFRWGAIPT